MQRCPCVAVTKSRPCGLLLGLELEAHVGLDAKLIGVARAGVVNTSTCAEVTLLDADSSVDTHGEWINHLGAEACSLVSTSPCHATVGIGITEVSRESEINCWL